MCALSGVAGEVTGLKEEKAAKHMLVFGSLRGMDSTGIASVTRYGNGKSQEREIKLAKEVGPFPYLWDTKPFDRIWMGQLYCIIGHNRSKTVGEATRKNAHPFQFENILGAHNGTIDFSNKNRLENGSDFRTDSEAIFNNIQLKGIEDTISRIDKTEAYALVWYDNRDGSINFLRNHHRPLVYCYANKHKTLLWASTYAILAASMHEAGVAMDDEKAYHLPVDMHHSWIIPPNSSDEMPEPKKTKLENRKSVTSNFSQGSSSSNSGYFPHKNADRHWWEEQDLESIASMQSEGGNTGSVNVTRLHTAHSYDDEIAMYKAAFIDGLKVVDKGNDEIDVTKPGAEGITEGVTVSISPSIMAGIAYNVEKTKTQETKLSSSPTGYIPRKARVLTPKDIVRKRLFKLGIDNGDIKLKQRNSDDLMPCLYEDSNLRAYLDKSIDKWWAYRFNEEKNLWEGTEGDLHPRDIPFTILDTCDHKFKHVGKGKRKKIYYKGYKTNLSQDQFNVLMREGCACCNRIPEWGNEVTFITNVHDFLCEYCSYSPQKHDMYKKFCNNINRKAG